MPWQSRYGHNLQKTVESQLRLIALSADAAGADRTDDEVIDHDDRRRRRRRLGNVFGTSIVLPEMALYRLNSAVLLRLCFPSVFRTGLRNAGSLPRIACIAA